MTADLDRVRDSKDPDGPALRVDVTDLVRAVKTGRVDDVGRAAVAARGVADASGGAAGLEQLEAAAAEASARRPGLAAPIAAPSTSSRS